MMCGGVGSAKPADDEVRAVLNEVNKSSIFLKISLNKKLFKLNWRFKNIVFYMVSLRVCGLKILLIIMLGPVSCVGCIDPCLDPCLIS